MPHKVESISHHLSSLSRHPLTLLIAGSILTSYLLPGILSEVSKKENERTKRLSIASQYISRNSEMNAEFNSLLTSLELFHIYSSSKYLTQEQAELRKTSKDLYIKYDRDVWWWHWHLLEEAKIWKLLPLAEEEDVKGALTRYTNNWVRVDTILPSFWDACLNEQYRVRDLHVTQIMKRARAAFDASATSRDSAIRYIASKFDVDQQSQHR